MSKLLQDWTPGYFTDLFLSVFLILVFIVSFIKRKKHPSFKFFPFYFASFIILQLHYYIAIIFFFKPSYRKNIPLVNSYIDRITTIAEFFVFMYFLYCSIKSVQKKKLTMWLAIVGLTIAVAIILKEVFWDGAVKYRSLTNIYILESSSMLIPCFFYYHELFSASPKLKLRQDANFWTITGLTIYLICTLPITFVLAYLSEIDYPLYIQVYSIIHIFYIFLFTLIIKSYLCKPINLT